MRHKLKDNVTCVKIFVIQKEESEMVFEMVFEIVHELTQSFFGVIIVFLFLGVVSLRSYAVGHHHTVFNNLLPI